ncbi:hypothetical protein [Vreelandella profundi]|uniref:hypothetical protein n=1 Tax=Vreelandella profundi TaxID=2852117 RepID=UPI001EF103B0|nr:hypothetical protein [Halomonas profundi]
MAKKDRQTNSFYGTGIDEPLNKLKGSIGKYVQPFEPVGGDERETLLVKGLTPDTAHADELATPTLKELGEDSDSEQ